MKRFTLLATAVVGLALGAAACSDSPVQPTPLSAQAADADLLRWGGGGTLQRCTSIVEPDALCLMPKATLCAALRSTSGMQFTFGTIQVRIINEGGTAKITVTVPGRAPRMFTVSATTIARFCDGSGGSIGDDDDDDRD